MIRAVSCDLGGWLGTTDGPGLTTALTQASPCPPEVVATAVREHLHPTSVLTDTAINAVAAQTHLAPTTVRAITEAPTPLRIDPLTRQVLTDLHRTFPHVAWVINSNAPPTAAHHATEVQHEYGDLFSHAYVSYRTGWVKGRDWQAFGQITNDLRIEAHEIIHIGDKYTEDVTEPLLNGCRALWVGHTAASATTRAPAGPDRFQVAANAIEAAAVLYDWLSEDEPRPALPVRAAVICWADDQLLITRGPDDHWWHLPGGRCSADTDEDPAQAAARELHEELGLDLPIQKSDQALVAWSANEASTRHNKVLFLFDASKYLRAPLPLHRDPEEIAEANWIPSDRARQLLHPRETARLDSIARGETCLYQHH